MALTVSTSNKSQPFHYREELLYDIVFTSGIFVCLYEMPLLLQHFLLTV